MIELERGTMFLLSSSFLPGFYLCWLFRLKNFLLEQFSLMWYNNAILLAYGREGDARWAFQKKLSESGSGAS